MAYGVSIVAYVGPERDDVRDHFVREARVREYFGKYRSQAHGVRLLVALPTAGSVDPRDVRIIGVRRNRIIELTPQGDEVAFPRSAMNRLLVETRVIIKIVL